MLYSNVRLLVDGDDDAGADGAAALADSEAEAVLDGDGGDQLNIHVDVVAGHAHLNALGQGDDAGHVGGTEVELGTVVVEERGVTAALVLAQDVDLTLELGVGVNALGSSENLAALDVLLRDAAEQGADVVAGLGELEGLVEHLGAGDDSLLGLLDADDLNLVADLDAATLDTAGGNGAAAGDGEDVLDGHQERLVGLALGGLNPGVDSVHELPDALVLGGVRIGAVALENLQSGALDDRGVVAGELVLVEQLADFHLDELEQLGIVDLVALVQEDDYIRNVNLAGEQQVLTGLSHGAVGGGDNEDGAVHLSSTGDHVLDVVGVTRAVDVGVVAALDLLAVQAGAVIGLVLDVSGVDRDAAGALLGSLVDLVVGGVLGGAFVCHVQNLGDSGGQSGLAVVDVADGANVDVGLGAVEYLLCHFDILLNNQ